MGDGWWVVSGSWWVVVHGGWWLVVCVCGGGRGWVGGRLILVYPRLCSVANYIYIHIYIYDDAILMMISIDL